MSTIEITDAIRNDAMPLVFVNVFLHQLGVPVPAIPTLLIAGSLAPTYGFAAWLVVVSALACLVADSIWYAAGRAFGYRVLSGLCRLAINPGSCVTSAEGYFGRWGAWTLVIAKFVPGLSLVGPPIAGSLKLPLHAFVMASALGAGLWATAPIALGRALRARVRFVLDAMSGHLSMGVFTALPALGAWLASALWKRHRASARLAMRQTTMDELLSTLASETPPLILDLRGDGSASATAPLPGALRTTIDQLPAAVAHWPKDRAIVIVSARTHGAVAARAAWILTASGYQSARPLEGGHDAWNSASLAMRRRRRARRTAPRQASSPTRPRDTQVTGARNSWPTRARAKR